MCSKCYTTFQLEKMLPGWTSAPCLGQKPEVLFSAVIIIKADETKSNTIINCYFGGLLGHRLLKVDAKGFWVYLLSILGLQYSIHAHRFM